MFVAKLTNLLELFAAQLTVCYWPHQKQRLTPLLWSSACHQLTVACSWSSVHHWQYSEPCNFTILWRCCDLSDGEIPAHWS